MKSSQSANPSFTVFTGSHYQFSLGQRPFGAPEVKNELEMGFRLGDTFRLSNPSTPSTSEEVVTKREVQEHHSSAPQYKAITKKLASSGRLYVRDEMGLRRADPMEIKERLDRGLPIEVVTRTGGSASSSGAHQSYVHSKDRIAYSGYHFSNSESAHQNHQRVSYTSSPITRWDSLDWADEEAAGVTGVNRLPASGGEVVVSESYESQWSRRASEQWGFFNVKHQDSSSGGYVRTQTN